MSSRWYTARGRQKLGPLSFEELKGRAKRGELSPNDMVLQEGEPKWRAAREVAGLCWQTAEATGQTVPLPPPPENLVPQPPAPAKPEDVINGMPLPPSPTSPTPPTSAQDYAEALENLGETTEVPFRLTNHAPLGLAFTGSTDTVEPPPLPPPGTIPTAAVPAHAHPDVVEHSKGTTEAPTSPTNPDTLAAAPMKPAGAGEKIETSGEHIPPGRRLLKWVGTATAVSAILGLIGDFLRPLAAFNLMAFVATSGVIVSLLVLRARRGAVLGHSFALVCAVCVPLATGFGLWWGLAHFEGSREKGYLAEHIRVVDRLQSAIIHEDERERLAGVWVRGSHDPLAEPASELRVKDGRMSWVICLPKARSPVKIDAEFSVTREGVVYGIITRIDYGSMESSLKETLPEEEDTFSFRVRRDDGLLTVKELRGKGFEELKKAAQGRYEQRE